MMEIKSPEVNEGYKIGLISILMAACFVITYYFHIILGTEIVFTHLFYIPIIITAIWWKRKAFIFTGLLSIFLIITHFYMDPSVPTEDILRIVMFFFVTTVVVILSEQMEKSRGVIEKSEKKYRSVVESAKEAIITVSSDTNIASWNRGAETIFGYTEKEMIGQPVTKIMPKTYQEHFKKAFSNYELSSKVSNGVMYESTAMRKNGDEFPFDISVVSWKTDDETFFTAIIRDITERKEMENELKGSEEKFREVFNKVNDMMTLIEIKQDGSAGNYIEVNEVAVQKLGYSKEEFAQMTPAEIGSSEKGIRKKIEELLSRGSSTFERNYYTKDGQEIPVEINSHIFTFKGQKLALSVARDITERKKAEKALRESEERYRFISENTADVIWLLDINSLKFEYVSPSVFNLRGYTPEEVLSQSMEEVMTRESYNSILKELQRNLELYMSGDTSAKIATNLVDQFHKDGSIIHTEVVTTLLIDSEGNPDKILGVTRDITERIEKERLLKESEEKYRTLFQLSPDYIVLIDMKGRVMDFNETAQNLVGKEPEEIIGKSLLNLGITRSADLAGFEEKLTLLNQGINVPPYEAVFLDKNKNERRVELFNTILKKNGEAYAILAIANDITERKLAEDQLRESLSEKEMLLKEIYHRVKNNLMVISSLLNIQSRYIKDKQALDIFKESQNRANSMALIHERLYRSTDLKRIDIADYIRTLSTELFHTYVTDPSKIELKMDLEDIMIDINTSIPLGLIINELVTNAMKHAFPGDMNGEINISFHKDGENLTLRVADNGVGFPEDLDYQNTSSLGLQLVNNLSDQIDAEVKMTSQDGTAFQITFKEEKYN